MKHKLKHLVLLLSLTAGALACNGDLETPVGTNTASTLLVGPTQIPYAPGSPTFSMSISPTTVMAGDVATITVTSLDAHGNPFSAGVQTILFNMSGGVSSGSIGVIQPKGNGIFQATFTGSTSGTATTIHAVVNGNTIASTASIAVTTGPAKSILIIDGNNQSFQNGHNTPIDPKVKVIDKYSNAIVGASVTFSVASGSSTVFDSVSASYTTTTDANGFASVPWIAGPVTGTTTLLVSTPVGAGSATNTMSAIVYDKPSTPLVNITGVQGEVDLAWTIASTGGGIPIYTVYRSLTPVGGFVQIVTTLFPAYSDTDATSGVYYYYVKANNGYIDSDNSAVISNLIGTTKAWDFTTANAAQFTTAANLDFSTNVCRLTPTIQTDDSTTFGSGTLSGVTVSGSVLRLGSTAACDGGTSDCNPDDELDVSNSNYGSISGYWKLNGTIGSIANGAAIPATTGTAASAVNPNGTGMAYISGKVRQGIALDGVDDYITMPNVYTNMIAGNEHHSISFWFKFNSVANNPILVNAPATGYYMQLFAAGINWYVGGLYRHYTVPMTAGNWYHVVVSKAAAGDNGSLYINGSLQISYTGTLGNTPNVASVLNLGQYTSAGLNLNGAIDDFAIWNKTLTAADVAEIYSRQSPKAGVLVSAVMDGLNTTSNWTNFSWVTTLPFFKALPDYVGTIQNELSSDYSSLVGTTDTVGDNNLMSANVGLWHLDEAAGTVAPSSIHDKSVTAKAGTPLSGTTMGASGKFGTAAYFDGSVNAGITFTATAALPNLSISLWVNPVSNSGSYSLMNVVGGGGILTYPSLYAGAFQTYDGTAWRSAGTVPTNQWTHLGLTFVGATKQLDLYVNGVRTYSAAGLSTYINGSMSAIGTFGSSAIREMYGSVDEVGLWSRALTPPEMLQLYRRGSNRVKFQARTCTNPGCSDNPTWRGPAGTAPGYYFSEQYNTNTQSATPSGGVKVTAPNMAFTNFILPISPGRYFQYRAILESDDKGTACSGAYCSPELTSLKVDPIHYDSSGPAVITNSSVPFAKVLKVIETAGTSCSSGIYYNFSLDKTNWYYWNSSAWVPSNGTVSNANTATNLMNVGGIANFTKTVGAGTVYVKTFLNSSGTSPCSIQRFELQGQ